MKKKDNTSNKKVSKIQIARDAGIARSTLYYKTKRDDFDQEMKKQILIVLGIHPAYGHKRIALEFPLNKKRILRIMKKFNIKPYRQQPRSPKKPEDYGKPKTKWKNEIIGFCPIKPTIVWASDFTYIKFQGYFIYLATLIPDFASEKLVSLISHEIIHYLVLSGDVSFATISSCS
jgi:transposase InsO family protein